jgi:hypothetical protein
LLFYNDAGGKGIIFFIFLAFEIMKGRCISKNPIERMITDIAVRMIIMEIIDIDFSTPLFQ